MKKFLLLVSFISCAATFASEATSHPLVVDQQSLSLNVLSAADSNGYRRVTLVLLKTHFSNLSPISEANMSVQAKEVYFPFLSTLAVNKQGELFAFSNYCGKDQVTSLGQLSDEEIAPNFHKLNLKKGTTVSANLWDHIRSGDNSMSLEVHLLGNEPACP